MLCRSDATLPSFVLSAASSLIFDTMLSTALLTNRFSVNTRGVFRGVHMQNCGLAPPFVTKAKSFRTQTDRIWAKNFFFWSSPNFRRKTGLNLSEDLFFRLHLILGRKTDLCSAWRDFFSGLHYSQISCPPPFENPAYATVSYTCMLYWNLITRF